MEGPRNPFAKPRSDSGSRNITGDKPEPSNSSDNGPKRMTPNKYQEAILLKELQDSNQEMSNSKLSKDNLQTASLPQVSQENQFQQHHRLNQAQTQSSSTVRMDHASYPPKPPSKAAPSAVSLQQAITKLLGPPVIIRDQRPSAPIPASNQIYHNPAASGFIFQPVNTQNYDNHPIGRNEARAVLNRTHDYIDLDSRRFPSREPPTVLLGDGEIDLYLKTGIVPRRDRSAPNFRSTSFYSSEPRPGAFQTIQNSTNYLAPNTVVQKNLNSSSNNYLVSEPRASNAPISMQVQRISFAASNNHNLMPYSSVQTSQRDTHPNEQGMRTSFTVPAGLATRPSLGNPFSVIEQDRGSFQIQARTPNFSSVNFEPAPQQRVSNTMQAPASRTVRYETQITQPQQSVSTRVISANQYQQLTVRQPSPNDHRSANLQITSVETSPVSQVVQQTTNGSRLNIVTRVVQGQTQPLQFMESTRRMSTPTVIQITSDPKDRQPQIQGQTQYLSKAVSPGVPTSPPKGLAQVLAKIGQPVSQQTSTQATAKVISEPAQAKLQAPEQQAPTRVPPKDSVAFHSMFLSDPSQQTQTAPAPTPAAPLPQQSNQAAQQPAPGTTTTSTNTTANPTTQQLAPPQPPSQTTQPAARPPSQPYQPLQTVNPTQQSDTALIQIVSHPAAHSTQHVQNPVPQTQPQPLLKDSSLWEGRSEKTDQYQLVDEREAPAPVLSVWAAQQVVLRPKDPKLTENAKEPENLVRMSQQIHPKQPVEMIPQISLQRLPPLEIIPPRSSQKPNFFLGGLDRPQVTGYTETPAQPPREGSWAFSAQRGSNGVGQWSDESQLARALDQLYSGQGVILQQLGNLAVGNPWVVLKELEIRTEKEKQRLEQVLLEKERMEGLIEGLREQLREERSKFQLKKASQVKEGRNEQLQVSTNEYRAPQERIGQPSYSKSQIVQGNKHIVDVMPPSHGHIGGDPLHEFASMMNSQIVGHDEQPGYAMESMKGDRTSVRSKGLSGSKITYNPPSHNAAQRNMPREVIESQAVNPGSFVPYYLQGNTVNENVPVLFDIRPDTSMHKSNLTGEGEKDHYYLGKKIVSRFATIVPGQATPNSNNDEMARLKEMNERLAEENRQLQQMLKLRSPESEQALPVQRDTERTNSEEGQPAQPNYRRLDYFGARPSIQTKLGAGFTNINLAIPDLRATQYSAKAHGELSPVIETDQDGVRVSGPPETEHLKETQLQFLQNYLSPEQPEPQQPAEANPTRGYNSIFSFHPSMEMISALTQYVNNPNMTAEQSGIKGLPLVQSKAFGFDSHMPAEGGRASVATGYFGAPTQTPSTPVAAAPSTQILNSQIADTTTGLKGSHTEQQMSASNVEANLDRSSAGDKPMLVGMNPQVIRRSAHQKKRNLSDVGRTNEDGANRITEVAEHEEGQPNTDRELEEELKKKDEEIHLLRTIIGNLAQDNSETPDKQLDPSPPAKSSLERTSQLMALLNDAIDHHFGRNSQASNQRPSQHAIQRNSLGSTSVKSNNLVPPLNLGHYLLKTANVAPARREKPAIAEEQESLNSQPNVQPTLVQDSEEYRHSTKVHDDSFGQHESPVRDFGGFNNPNFSNPKIGLLATGARDIKKSTEFMPISPSQNEGDTPTKLVYQGKNSELRDQLELKEADVYLKASAQRVQANYPNYGTDQEEEEY